MPRSDSPRARQSGAQQLDALNSTQACSAARKLAYSASPCCESCGRNTYVIFLVMVQIVCVCKASICLQHRLKVGAQRLAVLRVLWPEADVIQSKRLGNKKLLPKKSTTRKGISFCGRSGGRARQLKTACQIWQGAKRVRVTVKSSMNRSCVANKPAAPSAATSRAGPGAAPG